MDSYEQNQKKNIEYFNRIASQWRGQLRKPVLGCRNGSQVAGIGNAYSDEDITMLCDGIDEGDIWKIIRYTDPAEGDILLVNRDITTSVLENLAERVAEKSYPTCSYRTEAEENSFRSNEAYAVKFGFLNHAHEDDRVFYTLCHDILRADMVCLNSARPDFDPSDLYQRVRTIDMLDGYYVRALGNLNHFCSQEQVLCRKYLYTLDRIFAVWWVLEKKVRPPLYFPKLREGLPIDQEFSKHIDQCMVLNANATSSKETYKIPQDPLLNNRIRELLDKLWQPLHDYDKTETFYDLMQRTPEEFRPIISTLDMG